MRNLFALLSLLSCLQTKAQIKKSYWSVGVNPLGLIEVIPAVGPCVSYRLSPAFEFWGETSYLFGGPNRIEDWKNLNGYRLIFQGRYYPGKKKRFFIAPEFRLKHYTYNSKTSFINSTSSDTLNNYPYHGSQWLTGGALVFGNQFVLSRSHQLYLEVTAGVGSKLRRITRSRVPAGYQYFAPFPDHAFSIGYNDDNRNDPYVPLGFRLIWKLNR
jgi:Protein of unknown function (DUF3575)